MIGILVSNILGLPYMLGNRVLWPVLVSLILIPSIVQIIGLGFVCESPKFLYINRCLENEAESGIFLFRNFNLLNNFP